jgi:hypothetical protein
MGIVEVWPEILDGVETYPDIIHFPVWALGMLSAPTIFVPHFRMGDEIGREWAHIEPSLK